MNESKSVELLSYHNTEDELEFIKSKLLELEQEKQRLIQRQEVLNTTKNKISTRWMLISWY